MCNNNNANQITVISTLQYSNFSDKTVELCHYYFCIVLIYSAAKLLVCL